MKSLFILLTIFFAVNASASETVKLFDGKAAFCESKLDSIKSKSGNVYTLTNPKMVETLSGIIATIEVKFFDCRLVNGKYQFVQIADHMSAQWQWPMSNGKEVTVYREDLKKEVVAYAGNYDIVGTSEVQSNSLTSVVKFKFALKDLELNRFPQVQNKGQYYSTLFLRTISKSYTDEIDLGSSYVGHGEFRLYIDLENKKLSF